MRDFPASVRGEATDIRILVEPGDYLLRNAGDMAMLGVALGRLRTLLPFARIEVFTCVPEQYSSFAPTVIPLPDLGRRQWHDQPVLNELVLERLPVRLLNTLWVIDRYIKRRWPRLAIPLVRRGLHNRDIPVADFDAFVDVVTRADLIIATGMGGINDNFAYSATEILDVFRLALHFGARAAMMGQGFGPLQDGRLRRHARTVLRRINVIALREKRVGPRLLGELGVAADRVMITGDDAVELAYERRPDHLGDGLGINLRRATYAGVDSAVMDRLRPILHGAAARLDAPLVAVPISHVAGEEDEETIRMLIDGDGACAQHTHFDDITAAAVDRVHRCRVVVAGSYHAAVFALASGIPVVALSNSRYYSDKFLGLADQFGQGCTVIDLTDSHLRDRLETAIAAAWTSAPHSRSALLTAAARQLELGREAYRKVAELVSGG
jgi:polysaccharide pyruvyl transferase WcaK-like protein